MSHPHEDDELLNGEPSRNFVNIWFLWIGANILGSGVGLFLGTFILYTILVAVNPSFVESLRVSMPIALGLADQWQRLALLVSLILAVGLPVGFFLGVAQTRILRRYYSYWHLTGWSWLSAAAGGLALLVIAVLVAVLYWFVRSPSYLTWLVPMFVGGGVFGLVQWLHLRKVTANAKLWIPANALGWSAGALFVFTLGRMLPTGQVAELPWYVIGLRLALPFVSVGVFAAVTGMVLFRLQNFPARPLPPHTPLQPPHSTSPS